MVLEFMGKDNIIHSGGCHCKCVRWQVEAPSSVVAWSCNCSNCSMRANTNFVVPLSKFKLSTGSEQFLTTYTFGTHTAKHTFCKLCGITSFYFPRSNPDGVAVTVTCVDPGTIEHVEISSGQFLTTYTSDTCTTVHTFYKLCGITSFYYPRSNPDGIAVTVSCVDPGTIEHVETRYYDGKNWESSYEQSSISSFSKADNN